MPTLLRSDASISSALRRSSLRSLIPLAFGGFLSGCATCESCEGSYDSSYSGYSSGSYSSGSDSASATPQSSERRERTYLVPNRQGGNDIVFRKPGETTIVGPNGVTIIQRDRDGTRTVIDSNGGVKVVPPGGGGHRRRH